MSQLLLKLVDNAALLLGKCINLQPCAVTLCKAVGGLAVASLGCVLNAVGVCLCLLANGIEPIVGTYIAARTELYIFVVVLLGNIGAVYLLVNHLHSLSTGKRFIVLGCQQFNHLVSDGLLFCQRLGFVVCAASGRNVYNTIAHFVLLLGF